EGRIHDADHLEIRLERTEGPGHFGRFDRRIDGGPLESPLLDPAAGGAADRAAAPVLDEVVPPRGQAGDVLELHHPQLSVFHIPREERAVLGDAEAAGGRRVERNAAPVRGENLAAPVGRDETPRAVDVEVARARVIVGAALQVADREVAGAENREVERTAGDVRLAGAAVEAQDGLEVRAESDGPPAEAD